MINDKSRFKAVGREQRIYDALSDPKTKLYCLFVKANINLFDKFNLYLQRDEPVIHELRTICIELLTDLMVRFIKVNEIKRAAANEGIFGVHFDNIAVQKLDPELGIGPDAQEFLAHSNLSHADKTEFYSSVRKYFAAACQYVVKKFPMQVDFLKHAEVVDLEKRGSSSFDSVRYFINQFPLLCKNVNMDTVEQEFMRYQVDELPKLNGKLRIDEKWAELLHVYPNLSKVMLSILCVPHSNADSERVFSAVRKIQTCFRASMDLALLEALIIVKRYMITRGEVCYSRKFTDEFLKRAKSCTYVGLNSSHDGPELVDVDPMDDIIGDILKIVNGKEPDDLDSVQNCLNIEQ